MAVDGIIQSLPGALAATDLRDHQFRFVDLDPAGEPISVRGAALAGGLGVLYNNPDAGQAAQVVVRGVAKVIAGAVVATGARVASDAAGAAITTADAPHIAVVGGAAGDVIEVMLGTA